MIILLVALISILLYMLNYLKGLANPLDTSFAYIIRQIGQMMVVPFLFFSGYGILESFKKKEGYARSLPQLQYLPPCCSPGDSLS